MPPFKYEIGQKVNVKPDPKHWVDKWCKILHNAPGTIISRETCIGSNIYNVIKQINVLVGKRSDYNVYTVKFDAPYQMETTIVFDYYTFDENEIV